VQFIEDEAWDGCFDKTNNITMNLPQEEKKYLILASSPSNVTPSTPIQSQPSGQMTPSSRIRTNSHTQANNLSNVQKKPSQIGTLWDGPSRPHSTSSSDMSNPTLNSLRKKKIRSLRDIYEQNEGEKNAGLNFVFSLYSHIDDPIHFEEAIKEEEWVNEMYE
jgi:hypothetical protein